MKLNKKFAGVLVIVIAFSLWGCGTVADVSGSGYEVDLSLEEDYNVEEEQEVDTCESNYYREYVDSSCFEYVEYDEDDRELDVKFLDSGSVYIYLDVPYYEYEDLINADSIGGDYNSDIKGYYECVQVE